MNLKTQRQLQKLEFVQVQKRVQRLRFGRILMFVLEKNDLVQKTSESWIPVKIPRFSQIAYYSVQKKKADRIGREA